MLESTAARCSMTAALVLFMTASAAYAQAVGRASPPDFRGIRWGARSTEVPGLQLVESREDRAIYTRDRDRPTIGSATVDEISYGFYKDRFHFVLIRATGESNYYAIKSVFLEAYGQPLQPNQF